MTQPTKRKASALTPATRMGLSIAVATGLYEGVSLLTRPDPGAAAFHDGVEEDLKAHFGL